MSFWSVGIIGILLSKLFWPTVRKNCSSDQEKIWNSSTQLPILRFVHIFPDSTCVWKYCFKSMAAKSFFQTPYHFFQWIISTPRTATGTVAVLVKTLINNYTKFCLFALPSSLQSPVKSLFKIINFHSIIQHHRVMKYFVLNKIKAMKYIWILIISDLRHGLWTNNS